MKFAVQLMKRHRDIAFKNKDDLAPASIVLSTLAAEQYDGDPSVFNTVATTLQNIEGKIQTSRERLELKNPVNCIPEDLGERWRKNPNAYTAFKDWVFGFHQIWQQLAETRGRQEVSEILISLFGENPTRETIREDALYLNQARQSGTLGVVARSGLLTTQTSAITIPRNTFYGQ